MSLLALTIAGHTTHLPDSDKELAMQWYWEARQSGDPTANLTKIEPPNPEPPPPEPSDDPDDDSPPTAPGAVSRLAFERIVLQERWLTDAGFAMAPPLYTPGTRVLPLGDQNFRIERRRVESLPLFEDAAARVCAEIAAEDRRDLSVDLTDVTMDDHGCLLVEDEPFLVELAAFTQLAGLAGFGMGARYLAELCDPPLRARNVTEQLRTKHNQDRTVRLRTRTLGAERLVFAVVTPSYAAVDTDVVLQVVGEALRDAHTVMLYDGSGVRATALWMPDEVLDLAAGDVFKVGVRIETDDTGRGRIRISGVVFRNRCLNLLIIGEGTIETVNLVHRGERERILAILAQGVEKAREAISAFLQAWGHARTVHVDVEATLRRWVEDKAALAVGPRDRDDTLDALLSAWRREPGDTLADAVNAVTRAAHEHPTWPFDFREELERRAARLVLVPR